MNRFQRVLIGIFLLSIPVGLFAQRRGTIDMRNQPALLPKGRRISQKR
jgi:hypothetical protein